MPERGPRYEFVSPDKAEFRAEQKRKHDVRNDDFSLGERALKELRNSQARIKEFRAEAAEGKLDAAALTQIEASHRRGNARALHETFENVRRSCERNAERRAFVRTSLSAFLQTDVAKNIWEGEGPRDADNFYELLARKQISDEQLWTLLVRRQEFQENLQREWEKRFEQFREEYRQRLQEAIEKGLIPFNAVYDDRIDQASFQVEDPLATEQGRHGTHDASGLITVRVEGLTPEEVRANVFHELTHRISGSVIQREKLGENEDTPATEGKVKSRKQGLVFRGRPGSMHGTWLNEGFTEYIARYLSDQKQVIAYPYEQRAIFDMINDGIPYDLLVKAYFESRQEGDDVSGSRLPAFLSLHEAASKIYGSDWLKKIGRHVDSQYASG